MQLFWVHLLKSKMKLKSGSTYFALIELMCGNALLLAVAFDSLNVDSSAFLQRMKGCYAKQNKITYRCETIMNNLPCILDLNLNMTHYLCSYSTTVRLLEYKILFV